MKPRTRPPTGSACAPRSPAAAERSGPAASRPSFRCDSDWSWPGLVALGTWLAWFGLLPGAAVTLVLLGRCALFYSLPPIAAMRHGWGEPLNAVLGGMLLPLAGVAVVTGSVGPRSPRVPAVHAGGARECHGHRLAGSAGGRRHRQGHDAGSPASGDAAPDPPRGLALVPRRGGPGRGRRASPYVAAGLLVLPALAVGVVTTRVATRRCPTWWPWSDWRSSCSCRAAGPHQRLERMSRHEPRARSRNTCLPPVRECYGR